MKSKVYNLSKIVDELALTGRTIAQIITTTRTYEVSIVAIDKTVLFNWGYLEPLNPGKYEQQIRKAYLERVYGDGTSGS